MTEIQPKLAKAISVAKEFLVKAENFMKAPEPDYTNTVRYASASLQIILNQLANEGDIRSPQLERSNLYEITVCSYLNLDIQKYIQYRKMAGYWTVTADNLPQLSTGPISHTITTRSIFGEENARVSLEYCNETIIKIEKTLEQLAKPLSEK
jgi:hypothetical protein